jgi:hypothetical protein
MHLSHRFTSLKKVGILGTDECPYGCFDVFIGGETAPFECPLQSREEVEVAGRQVGNVGDVVQALSTAGGNMVDRSCCRVESSISQHPHTPVSELLAPPPHPLRRHDVRTTTILISICLVCLSVTLSVCLYMSI